MDDPRSRGRTILIATAVAVVGMLLGVVAANAHGVGDLDGSFIERNQGLAVGPYVYLGAKHMVTGFDHLLFLAGVIFFLYRVRDVALYVTLFAVGHSVTLLVGVLGGIYANPFLIDAVIGFSVAYKAWENLGGFSALGWKLDQRVAVLVFGLFHGFGLATKLQGVTLSREGLVGNMLSFNLGVELGQFIALVFILLAFNLWRRTGRFMRHAMIANSLLLTAGLILIGYQLTGYFTS